MLGSGFQTQEAESSVEALLSEVSLISKARFNYNFELHKFFSDPSKKSEISEFWNTICPFKVNADLLKCFEDFHKVTKTKVELYLEVQKVLSEDISKYDDIRLLDLCFYLMITRNYNATQEEAVLRQYEKDLRAAKLRSGVRKKTLAIFKEIALESSNLNKISSLVETHLLEKGELYREFFNQIEVAPNMHYLSVYNPSKYFFKKKKKLYENFERLSSFVGKEEITDEARMVGYSLIDNLTQILKLMKLQVGEVNARVNSEDQLENMKWRFEHFKELYRFSVDIDDVERRANSLINVNKIQEKPKLKILPKPNKASSQLVAQSSQVLTPAISPSCSSEVPTNTLVEEPDAFLDKASETIDRPPTRSEIISSEVISKTLSNVSQEFEALSVGEVAKSVSKEDLSKPFSPRWEVKKKEHKVKKRELSSETPLSNPFLKTLADRLVRTQQDVTLKRLFTSSSIHKVFNFKELTGLIETCGGQVINISGSIRRIILGKFASDTLDLSGEVVKLNVHAPHGKHADKDPLPTCIAKHFQCVLMQAGLTPKTLFSMDFDILRTPVVYSGTSNKI